MIKKITISGFAIAALFIMISAVNKPLSSGAPTSSTGAPNEQTCAMSGCHDDNSLNSGTAKLTVDIGKFGDNNFRGLPIKIKITDAQKVRFGFQVTALNEFNKKIGQFIITDSTRTQIIGDNVNLPERDYLTYTYYGTLGSKTGEAEWEANWIPSGPDWDKPGKVTFYIAAISANNDGQDKGDHVYTTIAKTSWEITTKTNPPLSESTINVTLSKSALTILNPACDFIKTIYLTDVQGKTVLSKIIKIRTPKWRLNFLS